MITDNTYITLLPTLIGGFIAIASGIISGLLIHRFSEKRESNKVMRQKCEEIYKLILILDHHTQFINNSMRFDKCAAKPPKEINLRQWEYKQLEMLVNLYLPTAQQELNEFIKVREEHFKKYGICVYHKDNIDEIINKQFLMELNILIEEYHDKSKALKEKVSKLIPID